MLAQFPEHHAYIEPFGGSGTVLLNKPLSPVEVYNDKDSRLFCIFSVLRDSKKAAHLHRMLAATPYHELEYREAWEVRPGLNETEQARRYIVALRMAFGGAGSRGGRPGFGFGKTSNQAAQWANFVELIPLITQRLRNVQIMSRDACEVIKLFDGSESFFLIDPPYVPSTRHGKSDYIHEMTIEQHSELASTLKAIQGKAIVCGYDNAEYSKWFKSWNKIERVVPLRVARQKDQSRTECIWKNF